MSENEKNSVLQHGRVSGLSRRVFLVGLPLAVAGCQSATMGNSYRSMYAAVPSEKFPIPALNLAAIDRDVLRQEVPFETRHRPGTIIVRPHERRLYFVQEGGTAMRYGVGVGRQGFAWAGSARIGRKAAWPTWTPPAPMIR
ncbi:MAG: L,D-transpeptidase, partial [Pseudomonadota bacterium]